MYVLIFQQEIITTLSQNRDNKPKKAAGKTRKPCNALTSATKNRAKGFAKRN